jgi:hypothetical protein
MEPHWMGGLILRAVSLDFSLTDDLADGIILLIEYTLTKLTTHTCQRLLLAPTP